MAPRIHLLGQLTVEADEAVIEQRDLPSGQERLAFAYLILNRGRVVPKSELASRIWPDEDGHAAELESLLTKITGQLSRLDLSEVIEVRDDAVAIGGTDLWVDVETAIRSIEEAARFLDQDNPELASQASVVAAGLAARPFLSGESGRWVDAQRQRLGRVRMKALEIGAQAALELRDFESVITMTNEVLSVEPEHELAFQLQIRAHLAMGNRPAAESAYRRLSSALTRAGGSPSKESSELHAMTTRANERQVLRTFMFTDMVDSTKLAELLGDDEWAELARWHDRVVRECLTEHQGEEVDHAGDGFLAAFSDQEKAVQAAIALQRRLAQERFSHGFAPKLRIGLHSSDATSHEGGYKGKGLHAAARIAATAGGGQIVASRETVKGLVNVELSDPTIVELKGLSQPVELVTVSWNT